ncbi:MAG: radical SAM protein [Candidatus Aenigmarchaeota archaeon]|nr:radical SAM protein [Candidatus Aenigmarchaeota archaeon]
MLTRKTTFSILKGIVTKKTPIYVQFAVTKRCSLKCKMCGIVKSWKGEKDLNLDDIERVANLLDELNVGVVILTGGEPFLRDDLPEIVKIFHKRGLNTRLQTSGFSCTEENVREVVKSGLDDVSISLNSINPKIHDSITNVKGSWEKTMNSISLFSRIMPKRNSMPVINCVLSRKNIREMERMVLLADKIGFYLSIIPVHLSKDEGEKFAFRGYEDSLGFSERDFDLIDRTYSKLIEMKKKGFAVYNSMKFLKESPNFIKYSVCRWKCYSPYLYFSISPGGLFSPCIDLRTNISVLGDNFLLYYRSKEFGKRILRDVKRCEGCMYGCWPEITYLCEDIRVLMERIREGIKIIGRRRRGFDYNSIIKIIDSIS